jgi:hypothetical protein
MIFGRDCDWFARLFILDTNVVIIIRTGQTVPSVLVSARCGKTACIFQACSSAKWKNFMGILDWFIVANAKFLTFFQLLFLDSVLIL